MSVTKPSPVRKAICVVLAVAFVLTACLSTVSFVGPQKAKAQAIAGEFIAGITCKLIAGAFSHTLDECLHYCAGEEGPDYDAALEQISAVLEGVQQALAQTAAEVKQIFAELKEMEFYQAMNAINTNQAEVETFYQDEFAPRFLNKTAGSVGADLVDDFLNATGAKGATRPLEDDFNLLGLSCTHSNPGVLDAYTDEVLATQAPVTDFSTTVESTNGVGIVAERPMYFDYQDKWDGGHVQAGVARTSKEFYFAEGTTRPGFDTFMCILNPANTAAKIKITYMRGDATTKEQTLAVYPHSRLTVNTGDLLGHSDALASDFSAHVESTNGVPVIAERPMYFKYQDKWDGGHCNAGPTAPAATSFLAEGTCRNNFETYVCIQNPASTESRVKATYMRSDGSTSEQTITLPPRSRGTLHPADVIGSGEGDSYDFSTKVETLDGTKVVVERPMYFNYHGTWLGGHCESGRIVLSPTFYFAEGSVRPGFHSYICMSNPANTPSNTKVTFMLGDGTVKEKTRTIAPHSRATVNVNDALGAGDGPASDFSARVETTDGTQISAERVMYFDYNGPGTEQTGHGWSGGHCEMGLTSTGTKFYFAEGTVRKGFQPYICIANPENKAANVKVTYMGSNGSVRRQSVQVPAHTRSTINVAQVWNRLQAAGKSGAPMDLETQYLGLENLFGQILADQVLAMDMICEYKNQTDPSYKSTKTFLNSAQTLLEQEMECFQDDAERMALSTASLAESPANDGTRVLTLTPEGNAIMNRATYLYQLVKEQSVDRFQRSDPNNMPDYNTTEPVVAGSILTTDDVNPTKGLYTVTAKDEAATNTMSPVSTFNNTITWQRNDGMETKTSFYDMWSASSGGVNNAVLNYSSNVCVTRFIFTGVTSNHTYDVVHGSQLLGNCKALPYDDEFNQVSTGTNIYGTLTSTVCNNGSRAFMDWGTTDSSKANWSVPTNITNKGSSYSDQTLKNSYDLKGSDPTAAKTCSTDGTDSFSGAYDFDTKLILARTFVPAQDVKVTMNCKASVGLGVKISNVVSSSADFNSYYYFKLVELDNKDGSGNPIEHILNATDSGAPGQKHLKADKDSSSSQWDQSFSGNLNGQSDPVSLVTGKRYQFQVYLYLDQNDPHQAGFGPTHLRGNATINTAYVSISLSQ
jgi:hypothetical protein